MRQHKCGTCRFYQEARLASSGWCHHPLRKTTSDLMIMVRKNELACRDEWSHDLWELRSNQPGAGAAPLSDRFLDRKMPPATESEIAAVILAERSLSGSAGDVSGHSGSDDVVLSELGAATERSNYLERPDIVPEWATPSSRPVEPSASAAPISDLSTRSAIIRARETYRERSRLSAARTSEIVRLTAKAELDSTENAGTDRTLRASDVQEDEGLDGVIEPLEDATASPLRSPSDENPRPLAIGDVTIRTAHSSQDNDLLHQDDWTDASPAAAASVTGSEDSADSPRSTELTWLAEHPEFVAASNPPVSQARASDYDTDFNDANDNDSAAYNNFDLDPFDRDSPEQSSSESLEPIEYVADEPTLDLWNEDVVVNNDFSDDLVDPPGLDLAAHLPRICRTCRDFRPAENGERGWCANQWAFSHRRMVDADERTPCDGFLGNWWLPVDEVWSEAADVSSHGQPTPLLDSWLPQPHQKEPTRRRS